ncbi:hypothetical protein [Rhizobium leguminosarum]|uniref:Uncharacterized protein n=1 Tax=Rhizobium leguminosarum TaxID=384 RepID=A0A7M3DQM8_RHILE|nr:hypothetical protein [Rhizobium leguminosarum]TAY50954.1 hypothetical protein ELH90_04140 [Rhizobium leguminosarum]
MAKITKKIRLEEYDVLNNEFKITFQLADYDNGPKLTCAFDSQSYINLSVDTSDYLNIVGILTICRMEIVHELYSWVDKPRKSLGGLSHRHIMQSRFEVTERLEQERRGAAEAERIIAAAPPLDWAMLALDELERDGTSESAWDKIKDAEWVAPERGMLTSTERDAVASQIAAMVAAGLGEKPTVEACNTNFVSLSRLLDNDIAEFIGEELDKHKHPIRAIQAAVDWIVAMETAGLGEEPAKAEVPDDWEVPTDERPTMFVDALNAVLPRLVDDVGANLGYLFKWPPLGFDDRNLKDAFRQTFEDAFKIASPGRSQLSRAEDEARYQARRKIAEDATDNAVNAIHTQARRFTDGMTMREHDFLRSVIQEEIEKVVGGVL